jgi:pteridine reductase
MQDNTRTLQGKTAFITGAAHRVGAVVVRALHAQGVNIVLHFRHSREGAEAIRDELNARRANSVTLLQGDLHDTDALRGLAEQAQRAWGQLDLLVNNASSFYPTPMGTVSEAQWNDLMGSNLKAPFFLSQAAAPYLRESRGSIVNIVDIHADRPLKNHPVYSMAKAGLVMLTKALARELGPNIRVNAVAPGAILWPDHLDEEAQRQIIERTALKRRGDPMDVARAIVFLMRDADYMTGQVLTVDGGRSLGH